jgi:hypothetical protein
MTDVPADITPQQLLALLTAELSASGAEPLVDADGTKLTLRTAVGRILWKNTFLLDLTDRPRPPGEKDDLYGHVVSARAEGLQNQALLAAICEAANIDVAGVLADAKAAL